jgi:hypothetical protein
MRVPLLALLLTVAAPAFAQSEIKGAPAADGSRPRERFVTVFGTDPCPKSTNDEIVVCSRRPDEERYRIPAPVRGSAGVRPGSTNRARQALLGSGAGGAGGSIGSCSAVGPGGGIGCNQAAQDRYREENNPR